MTGSRAAAFLPLVFVLLYGSGFVVAKIGIADASPLAFLVLRFVIASALAALIAAVIRAPWPRGRNLAHQVAAGLLSVAGFSGFSYIALTLGMPVAIIALVIALSPLVVATGAAPVLGERLNARQWCGLALGVLGVTLVIAHRLHWNSQHALGLLLTIAALLSLGSGTLYQKRFAANMNVLTGGALQSGASAVVLAIIALFFEHVHLAWTPAFLASLAYMSFGVSIGAMSVLYVMLQIGGANQSGALLLPHSNRRCDRLVYLLSRNVRCARSGWHAGRGA